MNKLLQKRAKWFLKKSVEIGLDYFPINFEIVPQEAMLEIMCYGLPTRARHWSYGQTYEYQKIYGTMGYSKVYEVVLNNDPSYAFLLDTNNDTVNTMVMAHVIGHVHFFKNNYLFKQTDRKMVYHAAERASRIEEYSTKYGIEKVEHVMNIGLAIERNIDWYKGVYRKPYSRPKKILQKRAEEEFDDLIGKSKTPVYKEVILNKNFPPISEYDLLWFLTNYATLDPWVKDVFEIIREESFYFYPQYMTKIMNEGFASYIHAELMYLMDGDHLPPHEHMDFCKVHERVVQPGKNPLDVNPYFLGFTLFNDIKRRWDEKHKDGESDITGFQKILEVVEDEDDVSFLKNYLTQEIVDKLDMFTYKTYYDRKKDEYVEIMSTKAEDVAEHYASKLYHYRAPLIAITKASSSGLELEHFSPEIGTLDVKHLGKVMGYLHEIWGGVVDLKTVDDAENEIHFTYDEMGFSDYNESIGSALVPD